MIKIFKQFKKKNTLFLIIALTFSAIECVSSTFQPFLLSEITRHFNNIAIGNLTSDQVNQEIHQVLIIFAVIVSMVTVGFLCRVTSRFFHIKSAIEIVERLRNNLFWRLQWIKDNEFNKLSVSSIVSRATNDSYQYQETIFTFFLFFFESMMLITGVVIFCLTISPILSSVFVLIIPSILAVYWISNQKAKKYFTTSFEELDNVNRVMRENIAGTKTVRSFRIQKYQSERFDIHNIAWYKSIYKGETLVYFGIIFLFFALNAAIIIVVFISGTVNYVSVGNQTIAINEVIAFANYLIYAVFCVFGISMTLVSVNRTRICIERIEEILKIDIEQPTEVDFENEFVPSLEFKNVSYSYGIVSDEKPIIDNISFKVNPGEILGIIGPTGSGKSTIVALAANLAEPESGEIRFGGYTSSEVSTKNIRKQVSVALQEKFIFSGTIKSNITMGNNQASQEKIEWAAKLACADEFINKTEKQYDSEVLQNGNNFSGGQKQRMAIARAFAKKSGIYILDDSLSALDNLTRDKVLKNIKNNFKNKTFIIVSQQVKTIKDADKIIVLDKGQIIDIGTHNQLVKKCALYNKIYDSQKTIGE
ncbi:ABC transporter ATP-binding protein [Malacoplasma penetrans]|uniref:ABC transporter ATP-binding protein n=1 Tax=Malacoplasma penetrans TaxID=28227 RepID=UPI001012CFFC|nr:ABC transporter ATP-binding protein [Malacoplasma penetrans]RXY96714.1 ABC transporter ATP-binding protein [Malacoplasma penetrans]